MTSPSFPVRVIFPGSLHDGDFDDQQFPAHLGPGKTDREADFIPSLCFPMTEFRHTQIPLNGFRGDPDSAFSAVGHDLPGDLPADGSDFPLQIPDPRLPGILTDDRQQRPVRKNDTVLFKPVGLHLLGHEEPLGDIEFFRLRISGQADDLHPVLQAARGWSAGHWPW